MTFLENRLSNSSYNITKSAKGTGIMNKIERTDYFSYHFRAAENSNFFVAVGLFVQKGDMFHGI